MRVAVLKYGTVNWELDVIRHNQLDSAEGVELDIIELASTQSAKVALQAGSADVIVTDWLWVSRTRERGADFTFVPYSTGGGAVMVPPESKARTLADLRSAKIGVAGGPLDKSWLIIRGFATRHAGLDLREAAEPVFGAPPLLNQKALQRELAAVLNYWHFCARLEAEGFRRLIGVGEAAAALGIKGEVPIVGYVFHASWAEKNRAQIEGFLRAARRARSILAKSDAEWTRIRPLMRARNQATFEALRRSFREAIPRATANQLRTNAKQLYRVLQTAGGERLLGPLDDMSPGTFWRAN